jgi:hypothetical protein
MEIGAAEQWWWAAYGRRAGSVCGTKAPERHDYSDLDLEKKSSSGVDVIFLKKG